MIMISQSEMRDATSNVHKIRVHLDMVNAGRPEPEQPASRGKSDGLQAANAVTWRRPGARRQRELMSGAARISPVHIIITGLVGVANRIAGFFIVVGVATR
jgi:hypothetical protein